MHGLDDWLSGLGGGSAAMALVAALLLGLRHATDPDHVAAVSTLLLSRGEGEASDEELRGDAGVLGFSWGLGHAVTVLALGTPVVFFGGFLPGGIRTAAEVAIGAVIVALAVRLLVRWRRGYLHAHAHRHGDLLHAHPHLHEGAHRHGPEQAASREHGHDHGSSMGRSPKESFGIGLVHGVGGSAGAGVLLVASADGAAEGVVALLLFAAGTVASMTVLSALAGRFMRRPWVAGRVDRAIPAFGALTLLFGVWYALGALELMPYAF